MVDAGRFHYPVIDIPPDTICPRCDLIFNDTAGLQRHLASVEYPPPEGHSLVISSETPVGAPRSPALSRPPLRRALPVPQLAEQLVDVPVPEAVILARGRSAAGVIWYHVAARGGRSYWWMGGSRHVQWVRPEGFTASPGRYINTGQAEVVAVVDVPVVMQLKFQQSFVVFFMVPQLQFIDRVVVTSVASQRQGSQCKLCRKPESTDAVLGYGCCARRCATTGAMDGPDIAEYSGGSEVAVPGRGRPDNAKTAWRCDSQK